ncbi:uncharacterized protein LOC131939420 [Physella acuta]|uniref:uncharacterized protein LOC131939420 n=1 Tax=Physella acuta TaxID=109671 RepID=UPI0027DC3AAD|nr:uncharacterized protein LOC131939420 [Physella acuta]
MKVYILLVVALFFCLSLGCEDGWFYHPHTQTCVHLVNEKKNFSDSDEYCKAHASNLMYIEDVEMDKFVKNLILKNSSYRFGIYLSENEGLYWEREKENVSYQGWQTSDDEIFYTRAVATTSGWMSVPEDDRHPFICQVDAVSDFVNFLGTDSYVNGKYFKHFPFAESWSDADKFCQSTFYNGRLAEPISDAEKKLIKIMAEKIKFISWIGASDTTEEGIFRWNKSGAILKSNDGWWAKTQPDDYYAGEDCVQIIWSTMINDCTCYYRYPFFCESEINASNYTKDPCFPYKETESENGVCYKKFIMQTKWIKANSDCVENEPELKLESELTNNERKQSESIVNQRYDTYSCKDGFRYHVESNTCLQLFTTEKTYYEAERYCQSLSTWDFRKKDKGRMVEVLNRNMDSFIKSYVVSSQMIGFIGLYRNISESFILADTLKKAVYFGWSQTPTAVKKTVAVNKEGWETFSPRDKLLFICQKKYGE